MKRENVQVQWILDEDIFVPIVLFPFGFSQAEENGIDTKVWRQKIAIQNNQDAMLGLYLGYTTKKEGIRSAYGVEYYFHHIHEWTIEPYGSEYHEKVNAFVEKFPEKGKAVIQQADAICEAEMLKPVHASGFNGKSMPLEVVQQSSQSRKLWTLLWMYLQRTDGWEVVPLKDGEIYHRRDTLPGVENTFLSKDSLLQHVAPMEQDTCSENGMWAMVWKYAQMDGWQMIDIADGCLYGKMNGNTMSRNMYSKREGFIDHLVVENVSEIEWHKQDNVDVKRGILKDVECNGTVEEKCTLRIKNPNSTKRKSIQSCADEHDKENVVVYSAPEEGKRYHFQSLWSKIKECGGQYSPASGLRNYKYTLPGRNKDGVEGEDFFYSEGDLVSYLEHQKLIHIVGSNKYTLLDSDVWNEWNKFTLPLKNKKRQASTRTPSPALTETKSNKKHSSKQKKAKSNFHVKELKQCSPISVSSTDHAPQKLYKQEDAKKLFLWLWKDLEALGYTKTYPNAKSLRVEYEYLLPNVTVGELGVTSFDGEANFLNYLIASNIINGQTLTVNKSAVKSNVTKNAPPMTPKQKKPNQHKSNSKPSQILDNTDNTIVSKRNSTSRRLSNNTNKSGGISANGIITRAWTNLSALGYSKRYPSKESSTQGYEYAFLGNKSWDQCKEGIDLFLGEENFLSYLKENKILGKADYTQDCSESESEDLNVEDTLISESEILTSMLQEYSPNNIVSIIWKDLKKLGYVRKYPEKLEKDYQYILPTDKKKHELKENIDFFSGEEDFTNYLKRSNILCDLPSIKELLYENYSQDSPEKQMKQSKKNMSKNETDVLLEDMIEDTQVMDIQPADSDDDVDGLICKFRKVEKSLSPSFVPPKLEFRENEIQVIENFVNKRLDEGRGGCILIGGKPGTGKTATMKRVLQDVESNGTTMINNCKLHVLNINSMTYINSKNSLFTELCQQLLGKKMPNMEESQRTLRNSFVGFPKYILVIDEIDALVKLPEWREPLRQLFGWAMNENSSLVLFGIGNTTDSLDHVSQLMGQSSHIPENLVFEPYKNASLVAILTERVKYCNVWDAMAIRYLASSVAAASGDVRTALGLMNRLLSNCMQNWDRETMPKIGYRETMVLCNATLKSSLQNVVPGLPRLAKLLLVSATSADKNIPDPYHGTIGALYTRYNTLCNDHGVTHVDGIAGFKSMIYDMASCSLMDVGGSSVSDSVQKSRIKLKLLASEIHEGVKGDALISRILKSERF